MGELGGGGGASKSHGSKSHSWWEASLCPSCLRVSLCLSRARTHVSLVRRLRVQPSGAEIMAVVLLRISLSHQRAIAKMSSAANMSEASAAIQGEEKGRGRNGHDSTPRVS